MTGRWAAVLLAAMQLALGTTRDASAESVVVWGDKGNDQTTVRLDVVGPIALAAGGTHVAALLDDGRVFTWGGDGRRLLGSFEPPSGLREVRGIAAGEGHTVARKRDGSVVAWGENTWGQTDVPAEALTGVIEIAAGSYHTVALKSDGTVVAWGSNSDGQTDVPKALTRVIAIAAGAWHTVALKRDGAVVAWGYNSDGQTDVPAEAMTGVIAIAAGAKHTVALKSDGAVVAWGENTWGQTKVPAEALTGVIAIAAGSYHTVALKSDGTVVAWGSNNLGETDIPPGLSDVTAIAAGPAASVTLAMVPDKPAPALACTYRLKHNTSGLHLRQGDFDTPSGDQGVGVDNWDNPDFTHFGKWRFQHTGDDAGSVYVCYMFTWKVLSVNADDPADNHVSTASHGPGDAQKWLMKTTPDSKGGYLCTFTNKLRPDVALSVDGRQAIVGGPAAGHEWTLEPVDAYVRAPSTALTRTPDATKIELLETYAPAVYLAKGEEYYPTSTEWAMDFLKPVYSVPDGHRSLWTIRDVEGSDDSDPLFKGNSGQPFEAGVRAPCYAFWSENEAGVNLVYTFYFGYNRGKKVRGSVYGNHVSDWCHITVRLEKGRNPSPATWTPTQVYYSQHDHGELVDWNKVDKMASPLGETHPVVYCAWGCHECYPRAGNWKYKEAVGIPLVDICNAGPLWKTWEVVIPFDYNAQVRLDGGGHKFYPNWMGRRKADGTTDYFWIPEDCINLVDGVGVLHRGVLAQTNAGAIHRWGNPAERTSPGEQILEGLEVTAGELIEVFSGKHIKTTETDSIRLTDGPTGPQEKNMWGVLLD